MTTTVKKKANDEFDDVLRKMLATPPQPKVKPAAKAKAKATKRKK